MGSWAHLSLVCQMWICVTCKKIPGPSEPGRNPDTTLSPTDWKCVTRVPQNAAFPK